MIFGGILVEKVKNGGNNGGNMMYNYGVDHREVGEHFLVLTKSYNISSEPKYDINIPKTSIPGDPKGCMRSKKEAQENTKVSAH